MSALSGIGAHKTLPENRPFFDTTMGKVTLGVGVAALGGGIAFGALKAMRANPGMAWKAAGALGILAGLAVFANACTSGGGTSRPPAVDPPTSDGDDPVIDHHPPVDKPDTSDGDDPVVLPGDHDDPPTSGGDDPVFKPPVVYDPSNPHGYDWPEGDVDCSEISGDYADWLMKNAYAYSGERDPFDLDRDGDGIACEDKPRGTDPILTFEPYSPTGPGAGYKVFDPNNPHGYAWPSGDVNCDEISGDYADWLMEVAPLVTGERDPFGLDHDGDGIACEDKPRGTDPILYYKVSTGYENPDFE